MISTDGCASWFLAQHKPNCAHVAYKNLKRQGFETFLPLEATTRKRNGRFVTVEQPLFPGYIFVAFDAAQGLWRSINSTYGVVRLVSFGQSPKEVPSDLISGLKQRCDRSDKLMRPLEFVPGDKVRMTAGPFVDFVAQVETIAPGQRVWLLMDLMGVKTRVEASASQMSVV